jgi:hypothetical protein
MDSAGRAASIPAIVYTCTIATAIFTGAITTGQASESTDRDSMSTSVGEASASCCNIAE